MIESTVDVDKSLVTTDDMLETVTGPAIEGCCDGMVLEGLTLGCEETGATEG